jgi:hypothetical protein
MFQVVIRAYMILGNDLSHNQVKSRTVWPRSPPSLRHLDLSASNGTEAEASSSRDRVGHYVGRKKRIDKQVSCSASLDSWSERLQYPILERDHDVVPASTKPWVKARLGFASKTSMGMRLVSRV